jgi:HEAT repeat protein
MARIIVRERGFETLNISLAGGKATFGRARGNTVVLRNKYVSFKHCEISCDDGEYTITDLDSTNGLFVGGQRVDSRRLEDGDKILAGTALMIFVADEKAMQPKKYVELLREGEAEERELAASLLGQFGTDVVAEPLTEALKEDPDPRVKAAAAEALGLVGHSEAAEILLDFFDTTDALVRNSVVRSIVRLIDSETIEGLTAYLKHADKKVRVLSAHTLGQIHSKRATEHLIKALDDDAFAVREAVVKALGDIGDPSAAQALIRAAAEPRQYPQVWVIESLGKIKSPESLRIIFKAMNSHDSEVREAAANALGKLRAKEAAPPLLRALDDPDPIVRRATAESLEKLRAHLDMTQALDGSAGSGRKTLEISAIGEQDDVRPSKEPMYGEDRAGWEKWWSGQSGN